MEMGCPFGNNKSDITCGISFGGGGERERKRRGEGEKKRLRMRGQLKWQKQEPGRVGAPASGISKHFSYIPSLCQAR